MVDRQNSTQSTGTEKKNTHFTYRFILLTEYNKKNSALYALIALSV